MERLTIKTEHGKTTLKDCTISLRNAMDKLAHYEDLEEQGLLLKLPCKVGDTVFGFQYPRTDITVVSPEKVERIVIETNDASYDLDDFGKYVFLTKSEAEKALAEMEKNNG